MANPAVSPYLSKYFVEATTSVKENGGIRFEFMQLFEVAG
jgi:hypothetical protein